MTTAHDEWEAWITASVPEEYLIDPRMAALLKGTFFAGIWAALSVINQDDQRSDDQRQNDLMTEMEQWSKDLNPG